MYPSFSIAFASLQLFAAVMASPVPESVGAGGECTKPDIKVSSVDKVKLGPFLVTGATTLANPNGGQYLLYFPFLLLANGIYQVLLLSQALTPSPIPSHGAEVWGHPLLGINSLLF